MVHFTRWLKSKHRIICALALLPALLTLPAATPQDAVPVTTLRKDLSVVIKGIDGIELNNVRGLLNIWEFNSKLVESVPRLRYMHRRHQNK